MKKIVLSIFILFISINVFAKGNITLSKTNITLDKGKTEKVTITRTNVADIVEITSLDTSVATVSQSQYFFDTSLNNSSTTITITAKKAGTTTIRIKLKDIATFDGEELNGNKDISIKVNEPVKTSRSGCAGIAIWRIYVGASKVVAISIRTDGCNWN